MPLKSFQGVSVFASTCQRCLEGTCWPERQLIWCIYGRRWSSNNTERSEKISDGVQSQATTCWIYSQGTTADHMYVKHTWVFLSALWYCSCRILFYKLLQMHEASWKGCGSIFLTPPGKRQTFLHPAMILDLPMKKNCCIHTKVWVWVDSLSVLEILHSVRPLPLALNEEWTKTYSEVDVCKCVCVAIFGKLIQEELLFKKKKLVKWILWQNMCVKGRLRFRPVNIVQWNRFQIFVKLKKKKEQCLLYLNVSL